MGPTFYSYKISVVGPNSVFRFEKNILTYSYLKFNSECWNRTVKICFQLSLLKWYLHQCFFVPGSTNQNYSAVKWQGQEDLCGNRVPASSPLADFCFPQSLSPTFGDIASLIQRKLPSNPLHFIIPNGYLLLCSRIWDTEKLVVKETMKIMRMQHISCFSSAFSINKRRNYKCSYCTFSEHWEAQSCDRAPRPITASAFCLEDSAFDIQNHRNPEYNFESGNYIRKTHCASP